MELVDDHLGTLLGAADPRTLVAVVSPYGLSPPGPFERIKRLLVAGSRGTPRLKRALTASLCC